MHKLARHKNSVPREEIDDEPVEKTELKWPEIGLQKCYWVSVDIKNSSSAGDALKVMSIVVVFKTILAYNTLAAR